LNFVGALACHRSFVLASVAPALRPKPLSDFVKACPQPVLLPRRNGFHAVADLTQALAHAPAMFTAPFPFLAITGRAAVIGLRWRRPRTWLQVRLPFVLPISPTQLRTAGNEVCCA
jgi:hypothetical protein